MDTDSQDQFKSFIQSDWCETLLLEFRLEDQLIGVAVVDALYQGLSAFYTFFDPDFSNRSLGRYAVLYQLTLAKELALPWVFLGYWIADCDKMNYKTEYQPLQRLDNHQWHDFKC
jgi:arginine-tRNA-protein transferase